MHRLQNLLALESHCWHILRSFRKQKFPLPECNDLVNGYMNANGLKYINFFDFKHLHRAWVFPAFAAVE